MYVQVARILHLLLNQGNNPLCIWGTKNPQTIWIQGKVAHSEWKPKLLTWIWTKNTGTMPHPLNIFQYLVFFLRSVKWNWMSFGEYIKNLGKFLSKPQICDNLEAVRFHSSNLVPCRSVVGSKRGVINLPQYLQTISSLKLILFLPQL